MAYTKPTISGYNDDAPPDDGSQVTANQVKWATVKDEIGDPLKNFVDSINNNVDTAFGQTLFSTVNAKSAGFTVATTEDGNLFNCTAALTSTLPAASDAGSGFKIAVFNSGTGIVTVDGDTSELINGFTTISLGQHDGGIFTSNGSAWLFEGRRALRTWLKGADVASATALAIGSDGNYFDITGTTTITSINTTGFVGSVIKLHFDGALTLTHDATDLILPGGANITTAAGDEAEFVEYQTGDYRCTVYTKANGQAVAGAGGLTLISTATASASSSIDFTSGIDSTHDEYMIAFTDVLPATDNTDLLFRTSTDGGSTFDATANDYFYCGEFMRSNSATVNGQNSNIATSYKITAATESGNAANEGISGRLFLSNPAGTAKWKSIDSEAVYLESGGQVGKSAVKGARVATADIDAVRFLMSSGNITSGEFKLYGLQKS